MKFILKNYYLLIVLFIIIINYSCNIDNKEEEIGQNQITSNKDSIMINAEKAFYKLPVSFRKILINFKTKSIVNESLKGYSKNIFFVMVFFSDSTTNIDISETTFYIKNEKTPQPYSGYVKFCNHLIVFYMDKDQKYIDSENLVKTFPNNYPDETSKIAQATRGGDFNRITIKVGENDSIYQTYASWDYLKDVVGN
jgi:hypothetical protein